MNNRDCIHVLTRRGEEVQCGEGSIDDQYGVAYSIIFNKYCPECGEAIPAPTMIREHWTLAEINDGHRKEPNSGYQTCQG